MNLKTPLRKKSIYNGLKKSMKISRNNYIQTTKSKEKLN